MIEGRGWNLEIRTGLERLPRREGFTNRMGTDVSIGGALRY